MWFFSTRIDWTAIRKHHAEATRSSSDKYRSKPFFSNFSFSIDSIQLFRMSNWSDDHLMQKRNVSESSFAIIPVNSPLSSLHGLAIVFVSDLTWQNIENCLSNCVMKPIDFEVSDNLRHWREIRIFAVGHALRSGIFQCVCSQRSTNYAKRLEIMMSVINAGNMYNYQRTCCGTILYLNFAPYALFLLRVDRISSKKSTQRTNVIFCAVSYLHIKTVLPLRLRRYISFVILFSFEGDYTDYIDRSTVV